MKQKLGVAFALLVMVQQVLRVPIAGSLPLFLTAAVFYLFSAASIGIFLGTLAGSMPQLGLLIITIVPLQELSGGVTPQESMPAAMHHLFRPSGPGHSLSWCRAENHLARPARDDGGRRLLLRDRAAPLPQGRDADADLNLHQDLLMCIMGGAAD